ncbi:hypothetical protein HMPREF1616_04110 [Escherichia coli 908658]|nr:hypothetical protein HMPREF1616_04110 [Escherichia coli 908658]
MGKAGWLLLQHCGCHTMAHRRKKLSAGRDGHRGMRCIGCRKEW